MNLRYCLILSIFFGLNFFSASCHNAKSLTNSLDVNAESAEVPQDPRFNDDMESNTFQTYNMHKDWNDLLKTHVSSKGKVNYAGFKADQSRLDTYLAILSNNPPQKDWSRDKKLAYWINLYNGYTIRLVISNYPIKSITELDDGKPWDRKWIKVGSKTYSLNNIENDIIRPQFKEPRIHFAVNCASYSCPRLRAEAYTAKRLDQQLQTLIGLS